jgi:hypothetical protein
MLMPISLDLYSIVFRYENNFFMKTYLLKICNIPSFTDTVGGEENNEKRVLIWNIESLYNFSKHRLL